MSSPRGRPASPTPPSEAIAYHDGLAASWDQRYRRGSFKRRAKFFATKVLPLLSSGGDWLDVGCGSGYFSRLLATRGAVATGVDGSSEMIAAARSLTSEGGKPRYVAPRFEVQRIERLAGRTSSFDGVICLNVLEYLDSPEIRFRDFTRTLRPGGSLVVSVPNRRSLARRLQHAARAALKPLGRNAFTYLETSRHAWTREALSAMAARNGLETLALLGFDSLIPSALYGLAQPSLLYLACRKPAGGEAA